MLWLSILAGLFAASALQRKVLHTHIHGLAVVAVLVLELAFGDLTNHGDGLPFGKVLRQGLGTLAKQGAVPPDGGFVAALAIGNREVADGIAAVEVSDFCVSAQSAGYCDRINFSSPLIRKSVC